MASKSYVLSFEQNGSIVPGQGTGTLKLDEAAGKATIDFGSETLALMMASAGIAAADIAAGAVTGPKLGASLVKRAVIAGGAAGNRTVTGITTAHQLLAVIRFVGAGVAVTDVSDLTSEFTISATNTINNTSGTATTGDKLLVIYA